MPETEIHDDHAEVVACVGLAHDQLVDKLASSMPNAQVDDCFEATVVSTQPQQPNEEAEPINSDAGSFDDGRDGDEREDIAVADSNDHGTVRDTTSETNSIAADTNHTRQSVREKPERASPVARPNIRDGASPEGTSVSIDDGTDDGESEAFDDP